VSLDRIGFEPGALEMLRDNAQVFGVELNDIAAEELGVIGGSAMIKDETRCIRCGLCALRCPANTITMEAYRLASAEPSGLIPLQAMDVKPAAEMPRK
jgi:NAD-dependent dihydropyrimidine dehydrogenase PreA subunit